MRYYIDSDITVIKVWWRGPIFLSEDKSNLPQLETADNLRTIQENLRESMVIYSCHHIN